jgi:hypothetical protein
MRRVFGPQTIAVSIAADHTEGMPSAPAVSKPASQSPVGKCLPEARAIDLRAIFRGSMVGAGGGLILSTVIGVAAVLGMASDGLSPKTIAEQLRSQWDLRFALALAELLMATLAGYTAAITAGRSQLRHALLAGAATLVMNLMVVAVCGSPLPLWLAAIGMALTVPLAAFGGYLASPRRTQASPDKNASALTSPKR